MKSLPREACPRKERPQYTSQTMHCRARRHGAEVRWPLYVRRLCVRAPVLGPFVRFGFNNFLRGKRPCWAKCGLGDARGRSLAVFASSVQIPGVCVWWDADARWYPPVRSAGKLLLSAESDGGTALDPLQPLLPTDISQRGLQPRRVV